MKEREIVIVVHCFLSLCEQLNHMCNTHRDVFLMVCPPMTVQEEHAGRKKVVVIDDELEKGRRLATDIPTHVKV